MFGALNSSTSAAPSSGGLFGAIKPQNSGNIFGTSSTTSGGLFGASTTTSTPQTTGNLFGSSTTTTSTPQTGLFGSSNQPATGQQTGTNLFGASNQNTSSTNLFGSNNTNTNATGNPFGTKASSVPVTPAPSGVGNGVSQSNPVFTRTTRFNDLPEDAKKQLEALDAMIQSQCRHSDTLKAMQLGTEITEGTSLLRQVTSEMHVTSASVKNSAKLLDSIRQSIDGEVADLLNLAAIVDAHHSQRMTAGAHNTGESLPNPLKFQFEFFSQKAADMEERMKRYRQTIDYVELQLKGLFDRPSPASIVPALKAQYSTFMALADKVAQLDAALTLLKEEYRDIWRHQTGSVRDPFAEIDQAFGLGTSTNTFQTG
ncbi:hypothetical protein PTTG_09178 [Puccinia triticina 1-1 BBBD Race 1]|uniref:Nucleoporin Nup54 alpha-helical domain-containing protein n=2 Tax=Puccinia triticina TaxID=208348 RepID=A0A180G5G0_PUCT1|nr:uncharacterized protein PtA15_4A185 [Puccinia triticina]OAV87876.1 hypothetical protein PTTG_09178 [Puccinia triticina 1-1 BBBD Race 1]WAQ83737.1 hypothetical protein PtA15_4A185 [Puccinia triticina]WAR54579.1 hypothetical protein PtB15_4B196 [Puccinia triticina]